ncbi:hypothetical protein [Ekhidna sp.]|uniref:hypothetical protein n=1 Tax=Ekhidna sp. TaxID=2608089 RepID=UPI003BAB7C26
MKVPTDLQILSEIYSSYYDEFRSYKEESRRNKIHVPIDVEKIANKLGVDEDIVFGRLYYHLNQKYGYKQDNGVRVDFFLLGLGNERHCVQFPLMASVLADLKKENRKFKIATTIAIISLIISLISLSISIMRG